MLRQHKQTIHAKGMRILKGDEDATWKGMNDVRRGKLVGMKMLKIMNMKKKHMLKQLYLNLLNHGSGRSRSR